jgi:hypothetical protein
MDRAEAAAVARTFAVRRRIHDDDTGAPAPHERLEHKILEELVYERVRVSVDLVKLLEFELDLSSSIERALAACARSPAERSDLSLDFVQRAWERLTEEVLGSLAESELVDGFAEVVVEPLGDDAPA